MSSATASRDDRLAAVLADLTEDQRRGQPADVDAAARHHPDLADELRALWATAQFAAFALPPAAAAPTLPQSPAVSLAAPESFGDYEIQGELGRGGMGVVYKARQRSLGRPVALKMMKEARLSSGDDRARFRAEAEAVARLTHPNIVTVHEVGDRDGLPFIVMEYVEGRTLAQRLADGPLPPREAARLVAQVARAVQHAHEQGILHRDLKPANVILSGVRRQESGVSSSRSSLTPVSCPLTPVVTDFGLAKRLSVSPASVRDWRTQTGAIVGTPGYMAPEQATGRRELTPATDVYALGAILYECLTGRPPFQATNPVDALMMVVEQEPVPPRLLVSGIDRDLEVICLKCLQKPPELRYAAASELAADLEAYLAGEALANRPSGLGYFLARMLRETHHVGVLENWGLLWIWHSLAVFVLCLLTATLDWSGVGNHTTYLVLWAVGMITWGAILWRLRRRAGPVLFVERQLAHAWAAAVCASIGTFVIEILLEMKALTLSPVIAVAAGMVFVFKAGILSGRFYVTAAALFLTAFAMARLPLVAQPLLGTVTALAFLIPGVKYYRVRRRARRDGVA